MLGSRYPTVEDLHNLPYTLQVIKEVLRLYPPAPFYVRDALGADALNDYPIAPGNAIMLSPYYTHRHPDFWEAPLRFNPDRWTPERKVGPAPVCVSSICHGTTGLYRQQLLVAQVTLAAGAPGQAL